MSNKVIICGFDTSLLPKASGKELASLMVEVKRGNEDAREQFVMYNMRLVLSIVGRFTLKKEIVDDVFQVGIIGLMKSIDNFNTSLNVRFSTYAVPMIIGEIRRFIRDNSSLKISRSLRDVAYRALKAREELEKEKTNDITLQDVCNRAELSLKTVSNALDAISEPVSLFDTVYHDDSGESIFVMDTLRDKTQTEDNIIEHTLLEEAVENLERREKEILFLRYYEGKTQMEISNEIGISQAQVSRLEKNALGNLRHIS
ncbi:MAG: sigma-70 family RNA polymerase sigma factor [Clostridia bacterium]